ncbi:MAPK/MAK/MRK overlapping kinase-like [Clytia hemisphaerica]|uniref:Protein kinase domain-containing protein n=1 Tax=Clytia hemisphaerica TaxID=252671 RepID=A0A7M5VBW0_9CNID|eukprot:TCONS_00047622-protein
MCAVKSMQKYRILGKKGEGTFSEVLKCQSIEDGQYYACKRMKQQFESIDRVNNLREIQCMRRLSPHLNIVDLKEVIFDKKSGTLALIIELLDMNLYEVIKGRRNYLTESKCRQYIYQTLKALDHMHRNGIFHRDIKPENILLKNDVVKLADFGSCRSVYSKQPYTEYISTRWYRAPECLLTDGWYTYKMDLWSIGCVFAEIASLKPLFPGSNELDQITKIHHVIGTPTPELLNKFKKSKHMDFNFPPCRGSGLSKVLSHLTKDTLSMVESLCIYDPDERPSAKQVLRHQYFKQLRDMDKRERRATVTKADPESSSNNHTHAHDEANAVKHHKTKENKKPYLSTFIENNTNNNNNNFTTTVNFKTTTLPKIPVATTTATTTLDGKTLKKKQLPPTFFPSILQEKDKFTKMKGDKSKRLGYAEYNLPSLHRLRHGNQL